MCAILSLCMFFACSGGGGTESSAKKTAVETPVIASKVYNGEKQTATIAANEGYAVTENEGGIDVGEYTVVLTLTDTEKYEWKTPDKGDATKVTVKFEITKATNEITSLTLENWTVGETPGVPAGKAKFGTVKFTYSDTENGTYDETVPTSVGVHFVKATAEGTKNYDGAEKTLRFEILKSAAKILTAPAAIENIYASENAQPLLTAGTAEGGTIVYAVFDGDVEATEEQLANAEIWSEEIPSKAKGGKYTVYYKVLGDENHSDGNAARMVCEILKNENAINDLTIENIEYGEVPSIEATAVHGEPQVTYSLEENGEYVAWADVEKVVGTYYVKITVAEDDTYLGATLEKTLTVVKATNEIGEVAVDDIHCGETPAPEAEAKAGDAVYKYATEENGEYGEITNFVAGEYFVKAFVSETEYYTAAESAAKKFTVSHNHVWTSGETEDVKQCACGNVAERFNKVLELEKAQRVVLNIVDKDTLDEYGSATLSLKGIDYVSVAGVKFGEKTVALDENETVGDKEIAVMVKDFGFAYGNKAITVTVTSEDGAAHEISVKVLLVTKVIIDKDELDAFGAIAKACEEGEGVWGGYFELGADIEYGNNYWTTFINAKADETSGAYAKLAAMRGFVGTFDGKGYKINALRIANDRVNKATEIGGFISKLGEGGVIRNVAFTNACVGHDRGLITYINNGTIENIYVDLALFGDNSWNGYSAAHIFGGTAIITARGGAGSTVKNVIIDVSKAEGVATNVQETKASLVGCYIEGSDYSDIYVICDTAVYPNILREFKNVDGKDSFTQLENGNHYKVYATYEEMAADSNDYAAFGGSMWTVNEGCIPYYKALTVSAPEFTSAPAEIIKGKSAEFKATANAVLTLSGEAIAAGLSLENGVVTVPAGIDSETYTITATSIFDKSLKAERTFSVINERKVEVLTATQEVVLDVTDDGAVNAAKTVEIDLTEKFAENAAVTLVKVGDEAITGFENLQIANGKITMNVAPFGIKHWGEKQLKFVFEADNTEYELTVPAMFITKTISGGDKSLRSIQIISDMIEGGGYYRFGGNVELKWAWYNAGEDHRIGVNVPFAGVIDGNGYAIDKFVSAFSGKEAAFVYQLGGGTIKNIAFTNIKLGAVASIVSKGAGTIENVFVKVAIMPSSAAGNYSAGYVGNETTIFGDRREQSAFDLRNVLVDYTDTAENIKSYKDKGYVKVFGTFAKTATVTNAVAIGLPTELTGKITDCASVYIGYTDGTNNGVAFPANNWDEAYWTVTENTVTWKVK